MGFSRPDGTARLSRIALTEALKSGNQNALDIILPPKGMEDIVGSIADARGLKRICMSCGVRFYDLNKKPINCPSCGTEFTGDIKTKARRGRVAANDVQEDQVQETPEAEEAEEGALPADDNVVSLEEVEEGDDMDDSDDIALDDDGLGVIEEIEENEETPVEKE